MIKRERRRQSPHTAGIGVAHRKKEHKAPLPKGRLHRVISFQNAVEQQRRKEKYEHLGDRWVLRIKLRSPALQDKLSHWYVTVLWEDQCLPTSNENGNKPKYGYHLVHLGDPRVLLGLLAETWVCHLCSHREGVTFSNMRTQQKGALSLARPLHSPSCHLQAPVGLPVTKTSASGQELRSTLESSGPKNKFMAVSGTEEAWSVGMLTSSGSPGMGWGEWHSSLEESEAGLFFASLLLGTTTNAIVSTDPKEQETGNVRVGGRPGLRSILSEGEPAEMTALCIALVLALGLAFGHSDQGNDEELEHSGYSTTTEEEKVEEETTSALAVVTTEALTTDTNSTYTTGPQSPMEFVLMVVVPLAALVILLSVVLLAIYLKSKRPKQVQKNHELVFTSCLTDTVASSPIFEEDTPSVMEIEMEELDKWMNSMNRNANYECLPTLKEEKEPNLSPRAGHPSSGLPCAEKTACSSSHKETEGSGPRLFFLLFFSSLLDSRVRPTPFLLPPRPVHSCCEVTDSGAAAGFRFYFTTRIHLSYCSNFPAFYKVLELKPDTPVDVQVLRC
ncbi:transmembrane protein 154 [Cricetulus griseus]